MIQIVGKYTTLKVMADELDKTSFDQLSTMANCPAFEHTYNVIMPDCHAGKGSVVGFTSKSLVNHSSPNFKIIPNVVGVDIGCGVDMKVIGYLRGDIKERSNCPLFLSALDVEIRKAIPMGFNVHQKPAWFNWSTNNQTLNLWDEVNKVCKEIDIDPEYVSRSTATLGGGNHFIELGLVSLGHDENALVVIIHTGSRNFGKRVCDYHQEIANRTNKWGEGLSWLSGDEALLYINHMEVAQGFAAHNRNTIISIVHNICQNIIGELMPHTFSPRVFTRNRFSELGLVYGVSSVHNYYDPAELIIRKGAIESSWAGIIPFNMQVGSILVTPSKKEEIQKEWNYSLPHGAGRTMSRGQAKRTIELAEYQKSMEDIYSTSVNQQTLDEAPPAYKDPDTILGIIRPMIARVWVSTPIFNLKDDTKKRRRK